MFEDDNYNDVYYKLYLNDRKDKVVVVCMQWFDEFDYNKENFIRDPGGADYQFDTERKAIDFLVNNIKPEFVDPSYRFRNQSVLFKDHT